MFRQQCELQRIRHKHSGVDSAVAGKYERRIDLDEYRRCNLKPAHVYELNFTKWVSLQRRIYEHLRQRFDIVCNINSELQSFGHNRSCQSGSLFEQQCKFFSRRQRDPIADNSMAGQRRRGNDILQYFRRYSGDIKLYGSRSG